MSATTAQSRSAKAAKTTAAWFPDGLDTPGLTLIKVEADTAEYWEGPTSTVA
jgi:general stress protein 26